MDDWLRYLNANMSDINRCMYELHQPPALTSIRGVLEGVQQLLAENRRLVEQRGLDAEELEDSIVDRRQLAATLTTVRDQLAGWATAYVGGQRVIDTIDASLYDSLLRAVTKIPHADTEDQ